jgi:hypothetical protein
MENNPDLIYLKANVKPILELLFEEIGKRRPEDLVGFSIDWLTLKEKSKLKNKFERIASNSK